jgi:hypothetical protein
MAGIRPGRQRLTGRELRQARCASAHKSPQHISNRGESPGGNVVEIRGGRINLHGQAPLSPWHPVGCRSMGLIQQHCPPAESGAGNRSRAVACSHCEERSDEAISILRHLRLLRSQ